jgi:hypothetical protein
LRAPYDEFVRRVDISKAIRLMSDHIGGCSVPVARDEQGRVIRQAERNLYLPQPNYLAIFGGECIDVCKLEVVRYGEGEAKIAWRTVRSPNGSAEHDDGTVTFTALDPGRTRVVIRGLQKFMVPLFWLVFDIDLVPQVKDVLVADAYHRFFSTTLDNFEACYEGRQFAIGRDAVSEDPLTERLSLTLGLLRDALGEESVRARVGNLLSRRARSDEVDAEGFHHFSGPHSAPPVPTSRRPPPPPTSSRPPRRPSRS